MNNLSDMLNQRFGRWVVTGLHEHPKKVHCKCDCGKEKVVWKNNLLSGKTKSCGCFRTEKIVDRFKTHGLSQTYTYSSWQHMINRCYNPDNTNYPHYGGRGITVCEEWREYLNFLRDMGERPEGLSIDRIDNDKGYSKENCRWATQQQQRSNTRMSRKYTYKGEYITLKAISDQTKVPYETLRHRLLKGLSIEEAVSHSPYAKIKSQR